MSISKEAKMISATFAELRKFGFLVWNFNSVYRARLTSGMSKLCDHIVAGETGLHFVEVKLTSTKDKLSAGQKSFKKIIAVISQYTVWINYWTIQDLEVAEFVFENILNGTKDQKGEKLREL
jgi:hypothetical protein